jgi:hypothetical protein
VKQNKRGPLHPRLFVFQTFVVALLTSSLERPYPASVALHCDCRRGQRSARIAQSSEPVSDTARVDSRITSSGFIL